MGATSVTGAGMGDVTKLDFQQMLSLMPIIVYAGASEAQSGVANFVLPQPTKEVADGYIILACTSGGGAAEIVSMSDNSDGQLTAFSISSSVNDTVYAAVVRKGFWPS